MDVKKTQAKPRTDQAGHVGQTRPVANVASDGAQVKAPATKMVEPPAPSAKKAEPFVGAKTAAQIGRISQLKGIDPDKGSVAYTRLLSPPDFPGLSSLLKGTGLTGFEGLLDGAQSKGKFPRVSELEDLAKAQGKTAAFEKAKAGIVKAAGDPFDKVGIFFEAEAKLALIDDADALTGKARVLIAGDAGKLRGLLPDNYKGPFADWTMKWDRPNSRSGADFHDVYGDDKNNNAAKNNSSMRERTIGGTLDGKFESKLPASDVQGTAVLGRLECAKSTGPSRKNQKASLVEEAIRVIDQLNARGLKDIPSRAAYVHTLSESEKENPMVLMAIEIPDFDPRTFTDKLKVDDIRHQLVIQDASGTDMFLFTYDFVDATRIENGKKGSFVEVEIERMDGSTAKAGLSELIELTNQVSKALGLTKSPSNKYARGMQVTE